MFCTLQQPSKHAALSRDVHPLAATTEVGGGGRSGTIDMSDVCLMQVHVPSHMKFETSVFVEANANVVALDDVLDEQVDPS